MQSESLDYHTIHNRVHTFRQERALAAQRRVLGIKPYTVVKQLVTVLIGIIVGLLAVALTLATEAVTTWKNHRTRAIIHATSLDPTAGFALGVLFHMAFSATLALAGAGVVQFWAPQASGAGVSLIMAYLNGNAIPDLLSLRALMAKFSGTLCGVTANVALGPEAPMIHLGACVAHVVTHAACMLCEWWNSLRWSIRRVLPRPCKPPAAHGNGISHGNDGQARWKHSNDGSHAEGGGHSDGSREVYGNGAHGPSLAGAGGDSLQGVEAAEAVGLEHEGDASIALLHSDADRREFISAGAAAGLAAAFGAPIGGVLFSMEEACTHWSRKVAVRCFVCTTVAVCTVGLLNPKWKRGILLSQGIAPMENQDWFQQLPLFVAVSMGGGLLGAIFNAAHKSMFRFRAPRGSNTLRLLEAVLLAAGAVALMLLLSYSLGTCVDVPKWHEKNYGFTLKCEKGYNDLATAFMSFPDETIRRLFSLGSLTPQYETCAGEQCYFTLRSLLILCPSYLIFMIANGGLALPGGLFMPSIMVGGSFGATCGLLLMKALPTWHIQPGIYAMCAATAMLGGVFRASISLVIIVVEGTQSTKFMLGIILAVLCSNWVGEMIHSDGVYETDLDADGSVIFLRPSPPPALFAKDAGMVMSRAVWCFREIESVSYVTGVLRRTRHNGFPVVHGDDPDPEHDEGEFDELGCGASRSGPLEGVVLRSQLLVLLGSQAFCDEAGEPLSQEQAGRRLEKELELDRRMRMFFRHRFSQTRDMASLPGELDSVASAPSTPNGSACGQPTPRALAGGGASFCGSVAASDVTDAAPRLFVDLRPFMDRAPTTVRPETPAERAHLVFTALGLRHLVVVDEASHVRGIITRRDLDAAAGHGAWRRNKMAPAPARPPPLGLHIPRRTSSTGLERLAALRRALSGRAAPPRSNLAELMVSSSGEHMPAAARAAGSWLALDGRGV
ncbi:hypothetical protein WJX81_006719 [Elliptochloris bilobata]|uniref:CBS domain-containing protein n=1 Tax=Elliptochloris bilobata TaxID=381761 RepID=A0AAW1SDX6_9CHLO